MSDRELNELFEPILRRWLGGFGFERSEVLSGEDHDGDPALFVKVHYGNPAKVPDADAVLDAIADIRDVLSDRGDTRFPYLQHEFFDEAVEFDGHG